MRSVRNFRKPRQQFPMAFDLTKKCWNARIVCCRLKVHGKLSIFFQKIIIRISPLYILSWFLQWSMFTVFFQNMKTYPGIQPVCPWLQSNLCLRKRARNCLEVGSLVDRMWLHPRAVLPAGASEVTLACKNTGMESSLLRPSSTLNHWVKYSHRASGKSLICKSVKQGTTKSVYLITGYLF